MPQSDDQVFAEFFYCCTPTQRNLLALIIKEFVDTGVFEGDTGEQDILKFFSLCCSSQKNSILSMAQEFVDKNMRDSNSFPYIVLFEFYGVSKKKIKASTEKVQQLLAEKNLRGQLFDLNETSVTLFIEKCDVEMQKVTTDIMYKVNAFAVIILNVVSKRIVFEKRLVKDSLGYLHLE